jgi:uncharacterized membrane protein
MFGISSEAISFVDLHLIINHIPPIALAFAGVFSLIGLFTQRREMFVGSCLLIAIAGTLITPVFLSGSRARDSLLHRADILESLIDDHQLMGTVSMALTLVIAAAALGIYFAYRMKPTIKTMLLLLLLSILGTMVNVYTGHLGSLIRRSEGMR